jgi:transposase
MEPNADGKAVQPEAVAKTTVPIAATTKVEPAPQPSQEEVIKNLVAQELAKYKEASIREIQSIKDRSLAEVDRARRQTETYYGNALRSVVGDDPDMRTKAELAALQAREQLRIQQDQDEVVRRNADQFDQKYQDKVTKMLKRFDVDPSDKRLNWASDEPDRLERLDKITESAETIYKANKQIAEDKYSAMNKRINDLEGKTKQEHIEKNSVSTSASPGSASDEAVRDAFIKNPSDPDNRRRMDEVRARRKR